VTRRRLVGRGAKCGLVAGLAVFLVSGCGDDNEASRICTTKTEPPVRVDDQLCDHPRNPAEAATHGWYYQQLPATRYDDEGYSDGSDSVVVVGVGQPVYARGARPPGSFSPPAGVSPQRFAPAPKGGGTVTRGGLGVSGASGSSGS
jgi:hypothetical protein